MAFLRVRDLFAVSSLVIATSTMAPLPADSATSLKSAVSFHKQGDYAHSIPILKQLIRAAPHSYDANLLLGEDLFHSGMFQEDLGPLRVASDARPEEGTALTLIADTAVKLGDFSLASQAFQSAVARSPKSEPFLVKWADYCLDRSHMLDR